MSRYYETPELLIRKYNIADITYTTSTPETEDGNDLDDDDQYNPFK